MNLSVATIIMFTTLVLGTICRTFNICSEANIPLQNLIIGVISGFLCFFTGDSLRQESHRFRILKRKTIQNSEDIINEKL